MLFVFRAVDGKIGTAARRKQCAVTKRHANARYSVDLGSMISVQKISLYGRTDYSGETYFYRFY